MNRKHFLSTLPLLTAGAGYQPTFAKPGNAGLIIACYGEERSAISTELAKTGMIGDVSIVNIEDLGRAFDDISLTERPVWDYPSPRLIEASIPYTPPFYKRSVGSNYTKPKKRRKKR
jgi:hypothetical protein